MIPRRTGVMDLSATIPTGNGQLPLPPGANEQPALNAMPASIAPRNKSEILIDGLNAVKSVISKKNISQELYSMLETRKLIVSYGDYCVISEKGLQYLVDFVLP